MDDSSPPAMGRGRGRGRGRGGGEPIFGGGEPVFPAGELDGGGLGGGGGMMPPPAPGGAAPPGVPAMGEGGDEMMGRGGSGGGRGRGRGRGGGGEEGRDFRGPPGLFKAGDWACPMYALGWERMGGFGEVTLGLLACLRTPTARPKTTRCGNINWERRDKCNMCQTAKPSLAGAVSGVVITIHCPRGPAAASCMRIRRHDRMRSVYDIFGPLVAMIQNERRDGLGGGFMERQERCVRERGRIG